MSGVSPSPPDSSLDEATEEGFILVRLEKPEKEILHQRIVETEVW